MSAEQREEQLEIPLSAQEVFRVPDMLSDRAMGGMTYP